MIISIVSGINESTDVLVCMYVGMVIVVVIRDNLVSSAFKFFFRQVGTPVIAKLPKNKHYHDMVDFDKSLRHEILSVFKASKTKLHLHSIAHTNVTLWCKLEVAWWSNDFFKLEVSNCTKTC